MRKKEVARVLQCRINDVEREVLSKKEGTKVYSIPEHTAAALRRYIYDRIPPGDFLLAVLSNDLLGAVSRADDLNRGKLVDIISYLYNEAPRFCWGSPQAVESWLKTRKEVS